MRTPATPPAANVREVFAERLALLFAEAGNPPMKSVARTVDRTGRVDDRGRPVRLTVQRLSDWRRGQAVPARFDALDIALRTLIGMARKRRPYPAVEGLYDIARWRSLWQDALAAPALAGVGPAESAAPAPDSGVCPYRGLSEFREQDAQHFFGRSTATAALLARVVDARELGGVVVLIGASGAGKSSLLRAGLVPALAASSEPAPQVLVTHPGEDPVGQLRSVLPALPGEGELDELCAPDLYERLGGQRTAGRWVVVVDQFEELFTLCEEPTERARFVRLLHQMSTPPSPTHAPQAAVVIGARADFYDELLDHPELAEALQARQMVLGPMTATELHEAITGPAKAVGLRLEPGLVELLTHDLGGHSARPRGWRSGAAYDAGALPLLSHALLATWQQRQSGRLTISGYRAIGGISGAVETTAERAWATLGATGSAAAMPLLLRLTRVGRDSQDTRRRLDKSALLSQARDRVATETALEVLVRARLVTLDASEVQITHEALLHAWPRLQSWVARNRAALLDRQRLEEDATAWDEGGRDPSLLYRGSRLDAAERSADEDGLDRPSELARQFLDSSIAHRRRWARLRRAGVALVLALAVAASVAAVVAHTQRDDAVFGQVLADADRLRESDPSLAAQLDLVAHQMRPDDQEVAGRILSTQLAPLAHPPPPLPSDDGAVYDTSFSPDGRTLVTASEGHTVQLWDLARPDRPTPWGPPLPAGSSWCSAARFSPDGRTLASANGDGTVRLWDVSDPANPRTLTAPLSSGNRSISLLAFSPDGRLLATANDDRTVRLWDLTDRTRPVLGPVLVGHTDVVRSVAFSPDGHLLASGGDDRTVRLWDVTDPARPTRLPTPLVGHDYIVHSVSFSPDGRTLVSGSDDKTARLWDITDPTRPAPLGPPLAGHTGAIWSVAFSPDGQRLLTGSQDGTARVWNVADLRHPQQLGLDLSARSSGILAVAFSPGGNSVATGGQNGTTLLWSLPSNELVGDTIRLNAMAMSPRGSLLATGGRDEAAHLWNVADPAAPRPVADVRVPGSGYIGGLAFTSNGRTLAAATADGATRLWDVSDPAHPILAGPTLTGATQYAHAVAISPDARVLATASSDTTAQLWDITDPARPGRLGDALPVAQGYIGSLAFSPDGRTLVGTTANTSGTVNLWDVSDPRHAVRRPTSPQSGAGRLEQASFSPDGRVLAVATAHNSVLLWDMTDPARPAPLPTLAGHSESVLTVAFSADGHTLASAGADWSVRLWDLTSPSDPRPGNGRLVGHTAKVRAIAFLPGGSTLASASEDNTVVLWNLDVDAATRRVCAAAQGSLTSETWLATLPDVPYSPPC